MSISTKSGKYCIITYLYITAGADHQIILGFRVEVIEKTIAAGLQRANPYRDGAAGGHDLSTRSMLLSNSAGAAHIGRQGWTI
jgi:hypothetical protein